MRDFRFTSAQNLITRLNELVKRLVSDPQFDQLRIGDSGRWTNAGAITVTGFTMPTGAVANDVLICDADGVASWSAVVGTPGGSNTEVQFNNSGAFDGDTGLTYDRSNDKLTIGTADVDKDHLYTHGNIVTWNDITAEQGAIHAENGIVRAGTDLVADANILGGAHLRLTERSSDPADPGEGKFQLWMSDGTGSGDDGDIYVKITAGGSTKTISIVDFSAGKVTGT